MYYRKERWEGEGGMLQDNGIPPSLGERYVLCVLTCSLYSWSVLIGKHGRLMLVCTIVHKPIASFPTLVCSCEPIVSGFCTCMSLTQCLLSNTNRLCCCWFNCGHPCRHWYQSGVQTKMSWRSVVFQPQYSVVVLLLLLGDKYLTITWLLLGEKYLTITWLLLGDKYLTITWLLLGDKYLCHGCSEQVIDSQRALVV